MPVYTMMNSEIEILMAVYNGQHYLSEQIASLFQQSYPHFHLIVRDNCSTDGTQEILHSWCKRYPERISAIYGDQNLGVIGNFSYLIQHAKADYVFLSDADDVWLPKKIEHSLQMMQQIEGNNKQTDPILIHSDLMVTDARLNVRFPSFWQATHLDGQQPLKFRRALVENRVTGCTIMMNRPLVELIRPIPQEVPMHDAWIALVASAFGHVRPLAEPTVLYRQHGKNDTGATQYGLIPHIKKIFNNEKRKRIKETRQKRVTQAQLFLNRYEKILSKEKKEDLRIYLEAIQASLFPKGYLLWKHDLLETGLLRQLYQLIV